MMKQLKRTVGLLVLLSAFACSKTPAGKGQVNFDLKQDFNLVEVTKSNVSDYTTLPNPSDFTIKVSGGDFVWNGKVSEWDPSTQLLAGNYSVTADYGALEIEGFDKPYFSGKTDFAVTGGQTQNVSIPVSLANTLVRITCTEKFRNYFSDYTVKLSRDNSDIVTFTKDETRAAFVDGYKFTVKGTFVGEMKTQTFEKEYTNLDSATAYNIVFDMNNTGGATITISFNNVVETIELGDVELND